jgi:hypothetical protein
MKKQQTTKTDRPTKELTLRREIVRELLPAELGQVVGGMRSTANCP